VKAGTVAALITNHERVVARRRVPYLQVLDRSDDTAEPQGAALGKDHLFGFARHRVPRANAEDVRSFDWPQGRRLRTSPSEFAAETDAQGPWRVMQITQEKNDQCVQEWHRAQLKLLAEHLGLYIRQQAPRMISNFHGALPAV
jgi:hypothetical protein